jgi:hypothetical protein
MVIAVTLALGATLVATCANALLRFHFDGQPRQELGALAEKVTILVNGHGFNN